MNQIELEKIKKDALKEQIPIIMDDTLESIEEILQNRKLEHILEIGTAVRIFCHLFFKIFKRKWKN
ncbi:MAG: hypothetical protein HFJ27_02860 [Clostridia bacterium]|nr:hypothetical protein [Clostridia bacterium]